MATCETNSSMHHQATTTAWMRDVSQRSTLDVMKHGVLPGFFYAYASTLIIGIGLFFAYYFVTPATGHADSASRVDMWSVTAAWDGQWYRRIATSGYWYRENQEGPVAFFPLFPLLASAFIHGVSMRPEAALLVVSNVSLFLFCGLFHYDLASRYRKVGTAIKDDDHSNIASWSVAAFLCFPMSFFLRAGYSESLFVLLAMLVLWGMRARWPILLLASLIGLATACRLVGIALIVPFWWHLWQHRSSVKAAILWSFVTAPLTIGGLLAFMFHLNHVCGNPLAFMEIQSCWSLREPGSLTEYVMAYLSLAPIRDVYNPESISYWMQTSPHISFLNARFLAPILFAWILGCIVYGTHRRWLTIEETLYSLVVIGIPFLTQGYRICMNSQGRYVLLAFPAFIVMGYALARLPRWVSIHIVIASSMLMIALGSLFVAWYPVY